MLLVSRAAAEIMVAQEPRSFCHSRTGSERELGRGCIVNITSVMSYVGIPGKVAYMASKHAAIGVTKASGEYLHPVRLRRRPRSQIPISEPVLT